MPLTNAEVDSAVPAAGEPNRALTNAALKELIADIPAAISAHEAAGDPHPGYLTAAEGNAAYQPLSANLTEYAAVNPTAQGLALLDDADAAAQRTTLGVVIGTDVDAFASTVSQAEAEAGVATTVRNWTAQRVAQAIAALAASGSAGTVHVRTGTTDTLLSTDDNDTVVYTNAGAITVTVPESLGLTTGITIQWLAGTGTITLDPTGATTLNGGTASIVLSAAAGMVVLTPTGTDAYNVVGAIGDLVIADVTDITASAAEINVLDGVTASTAELNILDGVTATAAELNALDGITATVTELNYTDGVTSAIQTQLNAKVDNGAVTGGDLTMTTARILGRSTASTGAIEEITVGSGLSLSAGTLSASGSSSSLPIQQEYKCFISNNATSWTTVPASVMGAIQGTVAAVTTPFNTSYAAPRGRLTASDAVVNSGVATGRTTSTSGGYMPGSVDSQRVIWEGMWVCNDTNTGRRWAAGLYANGGGNPAANVDPDAFVNVAMFGKKAGDTNIQVITNDAAGTGTSTDLGASFPAASTTALYFGRLTARGGGTPAVDYYIKNLVTGDTASGTVTATLPVADTLLASIMWVGNGPTTASAATFEASYQHIRLEYQGIA